MAFGRSRRYRPRIRRSRKFLRRRRTLAKIKKDIMKCNFPTKIKFMGLTEKKVMFLTKNTPTPINTNSSFYLDIMDSDNINSIITPVGQGANLTIYSNWDKFCILGIYIRFQPTKNTWNAGGADNIVPIKCTYNMCNVPIGTAEAYDANNVTRKQVFTFNSNESFTMYVPAPTTMCSNSPCVHKSKTWWSIADIRKIIEDTPFRGEEEDMSEDEYNDEIVGTPYGASGPGVHAGRIHLQSDGAFSYNVTINYKVALKG